MTEFLEHLNDKGTYSTMLGIAAIIVQELDRKLG